MLTSEEVFDKLRKELSFLKREYKIKKIGVFGSFAKGKPQEESDIDIIVEFETSIGLAFMDLADYLEKLFNRKVDILTPEGIRSIRVEKIAQEINSSVVYV
ncbi:MAG: nucleotidyltransferase family protein [Candidatus Lokiarchaeota archaeon]|nr:nucleotidyltransferase family protein [Candidatus Lokiarchaeota archaeon]